MLGSEAIGFIEFLESADVINTIQREIVIERGIFTAAELDELLAPAELTEPGVAGGMRFEPRMPEGFSRPTGPVGAGG